MVASAVGNAGAKNFWGNELRPKAEHDRSDPKEAPDDARPIIVLVHGILDEASLWDSAIERLDADRYRCIAIDLPGRGLGLAMQGLDLARLTDTVLDVIDGVTAPVIIEGHSMGALVAERASVARLDAAAAIVLLTPVVLRCRRR